MYIIYLLVWRENRESFKLFSEVFRWKETNAFSPPFHLAFPLRFFEAERWWWEDEESRGKKSETRDEKKKKRNDDFGLTVIYLYTHQNLTGIPNDLIVKRKLKVWLESHKKKKKKDDNDGEQDEEMDSIFMRIFMRLLVNPFNFCFVFSFHFFFFFFSSFNFWIKPFSIEIVLRNSIFYFFSSIK